MLIDIHTHILPGLDDGAKDMQESLELLRIAERQGIRGVIATRTPRRNFRQHQRRRS